MKILAMSLLQVVVFIEFGRTKVDARIVEGCVGSNLSLICNKTKVINILSVVLGDSGSITSWCTGASCCPNFNDKTTKANDNHVNDVNSRCNGQQNCVVNATKEWISVSWLSGYNDFERITYNCIDNGSQATSTLYTTLRTAFSASKTEATHTSLTSGIFIQPDETKSTTTTKISTNEDATKPGLMPIIVAIICLVVFVIIIVVVIVILKRKRTSSKMKLEVEMTDVRNGQNGIHTNQNLDTNRNPNNSSVSRQNDGQNCSSAIYEEPNNVVEYSVVSQETSPAADGAGVEYSSVDIIKSDHKTPATKSEDDGYSLAGDPDNRQSTCVDNVYEDVESKQSDSKAKSGNIRIDGGACKEPKNIGGQAVSSGQSNLNSKDKKSASNSKADEGVYKNIGEVGGTLSSPSSPYEPMTPIPSQSIYANESGVPFRTESITSSLGSGSEAHTPYCEMRSPSVKLKDDGARMLVDNELYSQ